MKEITIRGTLPEFPNVNSYPLFFERDGEKMGAPNFALVGDNDHIYSTVTQNYQLIRHEEAIDMVEKALVKVPEFGDAQRTVKLYGKENGRMIVEYEFRDHPVYVDSTDRLYPRILLTNSYDKGKAVQLQFGAFRLVCSNGMVTGTKELAYRREHHQNIDLDQLQEWLFAAMDRFSEQNELWKTWADDVIEQPAAISKVEDLRLTDQQTQEVLSLPEKLTGHRLNLAETVSRWVLFNIMTQYISHHVKSIRRQQILHNRAAQLIRT